MSDGDNLKKSVYPDCLLCLEKIFEKYSLTKGTINTHLIAKNLPPCPHKKVKSDSAKRSFKKGVLKNDST